MSLTNTQTTTDSKFRSILKPSKLLWRNNKTIPMANEDKPIVKAEEKEVEDYRHHHQKKSFISTPTISSFHLKINNPKVFSGTTTTNEIYELSTVDEGIYIAPDINSSMKYDYELYDDSDLFQFFVPSQDCLTRSSGQHSFFTPSSTLMVSV
ncbi:hypothetical protein BJ944DRAFT_266305 [Cunninghamella echinulata]|nr:hypothetical protein BJ944DRAFT_266305 [Cunninghamella echinulata]